MNLKTFCSLSLFLLVTSASHAESWRERFGCDYGFGQARIAVDRKYDQNDEATQQFQLVIRASEMVQSIPKLIASDLPATMTLNANLVNSNGEIIVDGFIPNTDRSLNATLINAPNQGGGYYFYRLIGKKEGDKYFLSLNRLFTYPGMTDQQGYTIRTFEFSGCKP